jgi:hypothetical protein
MVTHGTWSVQAKADARSSRSARAHALGRRLTAGGRLVADLDLADVRVGGPAAGRRLRSRLRAAGFAYSPRRHQVMCAGRRDVRLPYAYLGADDRAGPGYTRQPAVTSYYTENP